MPRAAVEFSGEWVADVKKQLEPALLRAIHSEPLTESELFPKALQLLGAEQTIGKLKSDLKRLYNLQFHRRLREKSANLSVLRNLKVLVTELADELVRAKKLYRVERNIQFGKKKYGRVLYKNWEAVPPKVAQIVSKNRSSAQWVLKELQMEGFVRRRDIPHQPRLVQLAVDLLTTYGLAKVHGRFIHSQNFDVGKLSHHQPIVKKAADFFRGKGYKVWRNFTAGSWVLTPEGPKTEKFKFPIVAQAPDGLHVALVSEKEVKVEEVREFLERVKHWGLTATVHCFAPSITDGARALVHFHQTS